MSFSALAVVSLLVCGALAAVLGTSAPSLEFQSAFDASLFYGAALATVIGSALLVYRDTYAFAWLLTWLGVFGLACVGMVRMVDAPETPLLLPVLASSLLLVIAGAAYIAATRFRRGSAPDILATKFAGDPIFETNDVQLVAHYPFSTPENVIAPVEVYLQNCVDAPRRVTLALDDRPLFGAGGKLAWRAPESVELGPSEVKLVELPFCCARAGAGAAPAYLCVRAYGPRGKRSRHRRAPYAARPLERWQISLIVALAAPFCWLLVWGRGGLRLNLHFTPVAPLRRPEELPEPRVSSLWLAPTS